MHYGLIAPSALATAPQQRWIRRLPLRPAAEVPVGTDELAGTPRTGLDQGADITVVVRYSETPASKHAYGFTAWLYTADGAVAANEPESAW